MSRIVVIGGANVDIKGRATSSFVGDTSNPGSVTISVGGVGRNIAENLARLGHQVSLLTVLGNDPNGKLVREQTEAVGVDLSLAVTGPCNTGTYLVILGSDGELQAAINDMAALDRLEPRHLEAASQQLLAADMLVADCNIPVACLGWIARFAAENGKHLVIEPVSVLKAKKLLEFHRQSPVFAITPNAQQLTALTGQSDLQSAIAHLHRQGFANVLLHRGVLGAVASDGVTITEVPAFAIDDIVDVTGAGDAAVAGLVTGILEGRPLAEAVRLGQAAAAITLASRNSVASELSRDSLRKRAGL